MWTDRTQLFARDRVDPSSQKNHSRTFCVSWQRLAQPKTFNIFTFSAAVQPHTWKKPSIPRGQLGSLGGWQAGTSFVSCVSPDLHHASDAAPISILPAPCRTKHSQPGVPGRHSSKRLTARVLLPPPPLSLGFPASFYKAFVACVGIYSVKFF